MPIKHLNLWMHHLPDTQFVNLYGPTEITCNCTYHIIDRNRTYEKGIRSDVLLTMNMYFFWIQKIKKLRHPVLPEKYVSAARRWLWATSGRLNKTPLHLFKIL